MATRARAHVCIRICIYTEGWCVVYVLVSFRPWKRNDLVRRWSARSAMKRLPKQHAIGHTGCSLLLNGMFCSFGKIEIKLLDLLDFAEQQESFRIKTLDLRVKLPCRFVKSNRFDDLSSPIIFKWRQIDSLKWFFLTRNFFIFTGDKNFPILSFRIFFLEEDRDSMFNAWSTESPCTSRAQSAVSTFRGRSRYTMACTALKIPVAWPAIDWTRRAAEYISILGFDHIPGGRSCIFLRRSSFPLVWKHREQGRQIGMSWESLVIIFFVMEVMIFIDYASILIDLRLLWLRRFRIFFSINFFSFFFYLSWQTLRLYQRGASCFWGQYSSLMIMYK